MVKLKNNAVYFFPLLFRLYFYKNRNVQQFVKACNGFSENIWFIQVKSFEGKYNLAVGNNTWNNCNNKGNINLTFLKYIPRTAEFAKKGRFYLHVITKRYIY